jgi:hypothetical protein
MVSFLSNRVSTTACVALKIVMRFCRASSSAEFGAKWLPRGCTCTLSATPEPAIGSGTEGGSAIAARGVPVKAKRTVTRESKCMIAPWKIDDRFLIALKSVFKRRDLLLGIELGARATSDLRVPIPRHLLDSSTMDRQAATLPHWHPRGAAAK